MTHATPTSGRTFASALLVCLLASACAAPTDGVGGGGPGGKADGDDVAPVCRNAAFSRDPLLMDRLGLTDLSDAVFNYTAWPEYDPGNPSVSIPLDVVAPGPLDRDSAIALLSSRFPGCEDAVDEHLRAQRPNVYIFFAGYGGAEQNNSLSQSPAILNWINTRDPGALIFAVNWNCAAEGPDSFCKANAERMALGEGDPAYDRMKSSFEQVNTLIAQLEAAGVEIPAGTLPADPLVLFQGAAPQFSGEGSAGFAYDESMSNSIHLAARLVDQLLVADVGDIHFVGYSMGAQSAARVLTQDFVGDGKGYAWQAEGVCEDGGSECTIAGLESVKWSFSMGTPGWSEALISRREMGAEALLPQYGNGGLLRIADPRFNNKLNVLNRRMDPTGDSHDTLARGLGDIMFGEYNHYSHDYAHPLFIQPAFVTLIEGFIGAENPADVLEAGIYYDNAGLVSFDDCDDSDACSAGTGYLAHYVNRSHAQLDIPRVTGVQTVEGVDHEDAAPGRAVTFRDGATEPFALNTFDQEDLRGGVEMYFRPGFDPASDSSVRGLFSYGGCDAPVQELMPEAYFVDGSLVFSMSWAGQFYQVAVDVADAGIQKDDWAHLAFTWELPTKSMTHQGAMLDPRSFAEHKLAIAVAQGLMRPLRTAYRYQSGAGTMRIYVNGREAGAAALGEADSERACLPVDQVLSEDSYEVNGATFPAYMPYAGYTVDGQNVAQMQPGQPLGTLCKAYRIRNAEVFFGCAQSATAEGDMDDIAIIWGPGRDTYSNVGADGLPVPWPIGG